MSQEYVAERLGVSRQAVSKWETGQSEPTTGNLLELAVLFEVSLSQLTEPEKQTGEQPEENRTAPGRKTNPILRTNLSMLALILHAGMLCACTQEEYRIVHGMALPDLNMMFLKLILLALCSLWMAVNLSFEKDKKQQTKNVWIEMAYCVVQLGVAWCTYTFGMGLVGYALVAAVLVFYLLYINPRYMNRPFGRKTTE